MVRGSETLRGREGRGTLHTQFGGGVIGLDKWFGDRAMVGVSVGGGTTNLGVSGRSSDGRIGSFALGVHGQVRFGDAYVAGLVSYGNFQTDLRRAAIPDPSAPFAAGRGSTGGNVVGGRVELGWRRHLGTLSLTPFAALEVDHIWQRPMTESTTGGSGGLAIRYAGSEATSVPLTLGGRIGGAVPLGEGRFLALSAELGWTHEFNPTRAITASFVSAPGVPFRIKGASAAVDSAVGAFDARFAVTPASRCSPVLAAGCPPWGRASAASAECR